MNLTNVNHLSPHREIEEAVLFILLRSGLWEREADDLSLFPLSGSGWERVYRLARQHTVAGIVFEGVCRLPDELMPPESLLVRWVAEADRIERDSRRMNEAVEGNLAFWAGQGLNPVLLKGQGIARMYASPLLREAGDIDLYFPDRAQRRCADDLARAKGLRPQKMPDGSTTYRWEGIEVEHHPALFDLHTPSLKKYLCALERRYGFVAQPAGTPGGLDIVVPSPVLNLLLLNAHILKHALGKGIGLRQLCDMARACAALRGYVDGGELKEIYRRVGISRWSRLLHSFLVSELGLPADCLPYPETLVSAAPLSAIVLAGGNFGQFRGVGADSTPQPAQGGKLRTAFSFLQNLRFSFRYAPGEAFWMVATLLKGQFKCS